MGYMKQWMGIAAVGLLGAAGCTETTAPADNAAPADAAIAPSVADTTPQGSRSAYFGDLHVHTTYSMDAFNFGTLATPDDAYRYARGEAITHPAGFDVQLDEPLDFYAVTDHGIFLGVVKAGADTSTPISKYPVMAPIHNLNAQDNLTLDSLPDRNFRSFLTGFGRALMRSKPLREDVNQIMRTTWADEISAADRHYRPGEFTTFAAYEFSSTREDNGSMHRNVIFRGTKNLPALPFSRQMSLDPNDLWTWMEGLRDKGVDSLAIPHNSNKSNGQMFELATWAGDPMTLEHSQKRARNEPLVEITQVKGTSETHPALSMTDEWAGFEIDPYKAGGGPPVISKPEGGYVREALKNGLALASQGRGNPFQFGFIGSSDSHTGAGSYDESNYFAKVGLLDSTPALRGSVAIGEPELRALELTEADDSAFYIGPDGRRYVRGRASVWGASGLAGVWADANTREHIFDAFRRKETFATSGPRLRIRFFAGAALDASMLDTQKGVQRAYERGVSMGGNLWLAPDDRPSFLVWAARDAASAPLQRLQVIKGWVHNGTTHEKVFDVACADNGTIDPATHRCPDNGARVNLSDCSVSADRGAGELSVRWQDPEYAVEQNAFYYARVLENPTCRWSSWDALRAGQPPPDGLDAIIQERAWSSPIWVASKRNNKENH